MQTHATITIRRNEPAGPGADAADEALCDEAGRWGLFGEVVAQELDDDRRPLTTVRVDGARRGAQIALRGQIAGLHTHAYADGRGGQR